MGCAIALEARRSGFDVVVVERNGAVGHGSTSASCGIVRRFYSQPGMIAMAHEAAQIWADWGAYLGDIDDELAVFQRPGMLLVPPAMTADIHAVVSHMRAAGVDVETLTREQVAQRFPFFDTAAHHPPRLPDDPAFFEGTGRQIEGAVFETDAGYVVSPSVATHNLRLAGEAIGVAFQLGRGVTEVRHPGGRFILGLEGGGTVEADLLVNAAGPHSAQVNALVGCALPLQTRALRREVHAVSNPAWTAEAGSPVPVVGDLDSGIYFRPEGGGRQLIIGSTEPECDAPHRVWHDDADQLQPVASQACFERQSLRLMKRFPAVRRGRKQGTAALYDVTVLDWYPIVDRTDRPGYFVCIGSSGSSFKTAPVLGALVARQLSAHAEGRDLDAKPITLELPRIGRAVDTRFLSRLRGGLASTGTVIG